MRENPKELYGLLKWLLIHIIINSFSTVRCMMFGFGDDQCPYTESVDLLEDLVIEYITEMVCCLAKLVLSCSVVLCRPVTS